MDNIRFIDLFCGIGGFRLAAENASKAFGLNSECVFSSDIDPLCRKMYEVNFGEEPFGDITKINENDVPDHDILFGGFPCQPFSIIGQMKGFEDTRGTLFFDIARILKAKRPPAFVLENVKQLAGHDKGRTLKVIIKTLEDMGYCVSSKILNALDYGLPQKRERVIIVGLLNSSEKFTFPEPQKSYIPLEEILEEEVEPVYYATEKIRQKRLEAHSPDHTPSIWHENKSGHISSYPYSCALRAGASHNYLLVNGERRLTPREMLRLQGFPDSYKIAVKYTQVKKQTGNAAPVNMIEAVLRKLLPLLADTKEKAVVNEYK